MGTFCVDKGSLQEKVLVSVLNFFSWISDFQYNIDMLSIKIP